MADTAHASIDQGGGDAVAVAVCTLCIRPGDLRNSIQNISGLENYQRTGENMELAFRHPAC